MSQLDKGVCIPNNASAGGFFWKAGYGLDNRGLTQFKERNNVSTVNSALRV